MTKIGPAVVTICWLFRSVWLEFHFWVDVDICATSEEIPLFLWTSMGQTRSYSNFILWPLMFILPTKWIYKANLKNLWQKPVKVFVRYLTQEGEWWSQLFLTKKQKDLITSCGFIRSYVAGCFLAGLSDFLVHFLLN